MSDWYEKRAVVLCPKGHVIDYYRNACKNEFGAHAGVWCEGCLSYIGNEQLALVGFREPDPEEWSTDED